MAPPLHILFFPFMASGHINPMIDMAKLFTSHHARTTILTTPVNAAAIRPNLLHHPSVTLNIIPFPTAAAGLPDGCENMAAIPSGELRPNFLHAVSMLSEPFAEVLTTIHPDVVVTDMFLPWTAEIAEHHDIPRIEFGGTAFFPLCVRAMLEKHNTVASLPPEAETLVIPSIPHKIEMLRSQMPESGPKFREVFELAKQAEAKTYGVLVNSFYELEPDYADHFRSVVNRKAWHIGPVSLCNGSVSNRARRGNTTSVATAIPAEACLSWLDRWSSGSVVYICFGSMSDFTERHLAEMALGFEASGHPFIWVVREGINLPEGFEDRVRDRGLIIRGWAPQTLILEHQAVGAFVTHCGWNSVLEGVSAGLPMVTWPLFAEQFFNERLVVEVLGIGTSVGMKVYTNGAEKREVVEAERVERAVREVMDVGKVAEERRKKARELGVKAKTAVEVGGSSYEDAERFIKEMTERKRREEV